MPGSILWRCTLLGNPFLFRYFSQLPEGVQIVYIYASDPFSVGQIEMFTDIQSPGRRHIHVFGREGGKFFKAFLPVIRIETVCDLLFSILLIGLCCKADEVFPRVCQDCCKSPFPKVWCVFPGHWCRRKYQTSSALSGHPSRY